MSDTLNLANSIWPNGMKVDSDGHAVFYPLGTNKVKVPTSSTQWPKGNKLVSPFVYQDDKLVGFVDTKALTTSSQTLIYLPYEHIEAEFSAINKGKLQIHAPNAITKKASWKDSGKEDIPEVQFKYKGYTTVHQIAVDSNYNYVADIANGTWSEPLWDLMYGENMFYECTALTSFSSDLPSLTDGDSMFIRCKNLESFSSDLPSLTDGSNMFNNCYNLASFNGDLSSLTDGSGMFTACNKLKSFSTDLPSLTNGNSMFYYCSYLNPFSSNLSSLTDGENMFRGCISLTSFSSDLPNLTDGYDMFRGCTALTSFSSDLSSLTNSEYMFCYCSNLTFFSSDLHSLTKGWYMFQGCSKLTSFNVDLSSLTSGINMFQDCHQLMSFTSDLSSLEYGNYMFQNNKNLTSFSSNLSNLLRGSSMFYGCSALTSFTSNLSSMTNGSKMFTTCKLDTASVQNIANTIKDVNGLTNNNSTIYKYIDIWIGNTTLNEQETAAFNTIASKGWTVYVGVNGGSQSQWNPTSLDGEETTTPIPFWAKPVPASEEIASYTDSEGNFYNILGGNYIYGDDISTYGMFTCEEDAATQMRLTPYVKPQTEIENQ